MSPGFVLARQHQSWHNEMKTLAPREPQTAGLLLARIGQSNQAEEGQREEPWRGAASFSSSHLWHQPV
jgi:hypothetical protein